MEEREKENKNGKEEAYERSLLQRKLMVTFEESSSMSEARVLFRAESMSACR